MTRRPGFPLRLPSSTAPVPLSPRQDGQRPGAQDLQHNAQAKAQQNAQNSTPQKTRPTGGRQAVPPARAATTVPPPPTGRLAGRERSAAAATPVQGLGLDSSVVRARMVARLAAQDQLGDARVLQALQTVERHRFVDTALVNQAYEDTSLPIGWGQTISKPSVVARMLELLCQGIARPSGRVLEIGTGCGYQAALLARLFGEVYSIERVRGLYEKAIENLRPLRVANLHLMHGDGMQAYAPGAPYVGIIAAAGGEAIPPAWLAQLAVGGRLVAPVQTAQGQQALVVVDRRPEGLVQNILEPVLFVPLKSGVS